MAYTTLVAGTVITASWANASVRDQGVSVFATAAARTSAVTSPIAGMLSWRTDGVLFEGYDGAGWIRVPTIVVARKTVDEAVNANTTLQNDDALAWAVAASGIYDLDLSLVSNSGTTPDIKWGWTFPASLTMTWQTITTDATSTVVTSGGFIQTTVVATGGTAGEAHTVFRGVVTNSTNAGTLQLQWAQNTSNATNTTVRAGSYGTLTRIG